MLVLDRTLEGLDRLLVATLPVQRVATLERGVGTAFATVALSVFVVFGGYANYWWVNAPAAGPDAEAAGQIEAQDADDLDRGQDAE